jgi:mitochondrial enoyl-[acyl-carrier protein] reductase / trans-2-enoyl-CoA reductase
MREKDGSQGSGDFFPGMRMRRVVMGEKFCLLWGVKSLEIGEFGAAGEVLRLARAAGAEALREGEVRVNILASPINPADLNWIEGTYGSRPELPAVPGTEAVGEVVESRCERFAPGARVIFLAYAHGWQEERVVAGDALWKVPGDLKVTDLAMLKVNPATAWRMLQDFVKLEAGDVVLQNAANSGVGRCVIQIGRALGLRVLHFVRRSEVMAELRELGAEFVFLDDEAGKQEALALMVEWGVKAKLALNAVGGESALRQLDFLEEGAVQVTYGAMGRRPVTVPNKFLIFRDVSCRGFWLSRWMQRASADEVGAMYGQLLELMREGKLRQAVDSVHGLADYRAALERLKAQDRCGKVLFVAEG